MLAGTAVAALRDRIAEALSPLVGLPLWGAMRALNMEMFKFGDRRRCLNRKGEEIEVGDLDLHIACPWRIVGPEGVVVGSRDRHYPADEDSDWQEFDDEKDLARLEARLSAWLDDHRDAPPRVQRVEADAVGGFRIFLAEGFVLEAFPAGSLRGEYSEHWRLFGPAMGDRHFVVTGYGVEDDS